jgi:Ca2+-binding RTX toxin-like protein
MLKPTGRRSRRHVGPVLAVVLVAAGAAWAGGSPLAGAAEDPLMCFGKPATIIGTAGDDTLTGTPGDDVIVGLEGTDTINTSGGTDWVCGGPNDLSVGAGGVPRYERITVESGNVDGGPGLDWIATQFPFPGGQILGGSNPTVRDNQGRLWRERIGATADGLEISGGDGPDRVDVGLVAEGGSARVDVGAGNDVVNCFGDDIGSRCDLDGGAGNDVMKARSAFHANLSGGSGNDRLSARDFGILLDGGLGDDVLLSESGWEETLRGGPGRDRLTAHSGFRSSGPHILQGGTGADSLVGLGARAEVFGGGSGSDTIRAGGGSDRAWGGTGRDVLGGASGRDSLYGGAGLDDNYGGPGSDLCRSPQRGPRAHSCQR